MNTKATLLKPAFAGARSILCALAAIFFAVTNLNINAMDEPTASHWLRMKAGDAKHLDRQTGAVTGTDLLLKNAMLAAADTLDGKDLPEPIAADKANLGRQLGKAALLAYRDSERFYEKENLELGRLANEAGDALSIGMRALGADYPEDIYYPPTGKGVFKEVKIDVPHHASSSESREKSSKVPVRQAQVGQKIWLTPPTPRPTNAER